MASSPHERLADMDPDKLEKLVEHADTLQDLAEAREDRSLSRRDAMALGLGALIGGGGAASAVDSARAQASTSNSYGDAGEPGDRIDVFANGVDTPTITDTETDTTYDVGDDLAGGGGIFEDTDGDGTYEQTTGSGISTDELSRNHSHRIGSTVYYDPRDRGPYVDLADAVADVPRHGTLKLASTRIIISEEGPIHASQPIFVEGSGGGRDPNADHYDGKSGTILENSAYYASSIDDYAIDINGSGQYAGVKDLVIYTAAANNAGIRINDIVRTDIRNVEVDAYGTQGYRGIELTGDNYFARMMNVHATGGSDTPMHISTTGWGNLLLGVHCNTTVDGVPALNFDARNPWIIGGEFASQGSNARGIDFENTHSYDHRGGYVSTTTERTPTGFNVKGGTNKWKDLVFDNCFAVGGNTGTVYRFDNAENCVVRDPAVEQPGSTTLGAWSSNAVDCGFVGGRRNFEGTDWTIVSGATNPYVKVRGSHTDTEINNITTKSGLKIMVEHSATQNAPVWYDGSGWFHGSSTSYTPT